MMMLCDFIIVSLLVPLLVSLVNIKAIMPVYDSKACMQLHNELTTGDQQP